jgi:hypothetical protein
VDADGKFKACGLPPGDYHLMATLHKLGDREDPAKLGWDQVTITKEDISDLHLYASPGQAVHGRVEWAGLAPEEPTAAKVVISLWARNRDGMVQGEQPDARAAIPGEFVVSNVFTGDYSAKAFVADASVYVQDVLYGSTSVFREPFHIGSAGGADELRVILARDGGTIAAKVADKDGNPLPDAKVVIMPAALRSEADLPDAMAVGETDQDGNYSYGVLRPGKYLVFATTARVDHSVESIAKLWGLSSRLEPVELGPNAQLQLTLTPLVIE